MPNRLAFFGTIVGFASAAFPAAAQQATIGTPMRGISDGFFENVGVGFAARGPNLFFSNGGPVTPPFGGFDPGAGASLGFGFSGPGFNGAFNIVAGQGSSRSISSVSPSVTVMNGGQGFIADVTQQPFVIGVVPVVGGGFAGAVGGTFGPIGAPIITQGPTVLDERLARLRDAGRLSASGSSSREPPPDMGQPAKPDDAVARRLALATESSAGRWAASIATIRKQHAAEDELQSREAQSFFDRGREAQKAGKLQFA